MNEIAENKIVSTHLRYFHRDCWSQFANKKWWNGVVGSIFARTTLQTKLRTTMSSSVESRRGRFRELDSMILCA